MFMDKKVGRGQSSCFSRRVRKRGISAVVAMVLIVLITVAAVTIVWVAIIPRVQDKLEFSALDGRVSIVTAGGYTVCDSESDVISIQVEQAVGDVDVGEIKLIIGYGGSSCSRVVDAPGPNERRTYAYNVSGYGCDYDFVGVAPIVEGKEGEITSRVSIASGSLGDIPLGLLNFFDGCGGDEYECEDDGKVNYGGGCAMPIDNCGPLNVPGETYLLQGNIDEVTEGCFVIGADGVTLDLGGHRIEGDAYREDDDDEDEFDSGIFNGGYDDITIKNGYIYDFGVGVKSRDGDNWMITNMIITNSEDTGDSDVYGIKLDGGSGNSIIGNDISNLDSKNGIVYGIYLSSGSGNIIEGNTVNENDDYGIQIHGGTLNNLTDNTARMNDEYGISLYSTTNNILTNNIASLGGDNHGIYLYESSGNTLMGNTANYNSDSAGIYLRSSSNNIIRDSNLYENGWVGIYLSSGSDNNDVYCGTFDHNSGGDIFDGGTDNIYYGPTMPEEWDEDNWVEDYSCD